ncbi:hypothetical protein D3C85_1134240 [compost metagenome]
MPASTVMVPFALVNLKALDNRFLIICAKRVWSVVIVSGKLSANLNSKLMSFWFATSTNSDLVWL